MWQNPVMLPCDVAKPCGVTLGCGKALWSDLIWGVTCETVSLMTVGKPHKVCHLHIRCFKQCQQGDPPTIEQMPVSTGDPSTVA